MVVAAISPRPCLITEIFAPVVLDLQRSFRGGVRSATVAEPVSRRMRQDHDITSRELQRRSTLDCDAEFAFLNHVDASRPTLEFDVEAGPKFGC